MHEKGRQSEEEAIVPVGHAYQQGGRQDRQARRADRHAGACGHKQARRPRAQRDRTSGERDAHQSDLGVAFRFRVQGLGER